MKQFYVKDGPWYYDSVTEASSREDVRPARTVTEARLVLSQVRGRVGNLVDPKVVLVTDEYDDVDDWTIEVEVPS